MPALETARADRSAKALTLAAYVSFVPIGLMTVFLGPMLPTLSARWSLNYSQAGSLATVLFTSAMLGVILSGAVVSRFGYRFAIKAGLLCEAFGMAFLLAGTKSLGVICIAAFGACQGLAIPPANLMVAEANPQRRSATLNLLNFFWSAGAVACPFLVAAAVRTNRVPILLAMVSGFALLVALGIAAMPSHIVEPAVRADDGTTVKINWKHPALPVIGALFLVYVGTENAFGLWIAFYAKSLGSLTSATAAITPSFFYASLMAGRWIAPLMLRATDEIAMARAGLVLACAGMGGLAFAHDLPGVAVSGCLAGLGLSSVYPVTIALLSREFGPAGSKIASLMFTLSNLGGASFPWLVGFTSNQFASLKVGLSVPLIGGIAMFLLYLRDWKSEASVVQEA